MEGNTKGRRIAAIVAALIALASGFGARWYITATQFERSIGEASDVPWVALAMVAVMATTFAVALAQPVKR